MEWNINMLSVWTAAPTAERTLHVCHAGRVKVVEGLIECRSSVEHPYTNTTTGEWNSLRGVCTGASKSCTLHSSHAARVEVQWLVE